MREDFCYWSVALGERAQASAAEMVRTARALGVFKEFHIWSATPIPDATTHPLGDCDVRGGLYRLTYLRDAVAPLKFAHFVWLDPATRFMRHPGSVLGMLAGAPIHVPLTFDLAAPENVARDWNGCPCPELARLMRESGLLNRAIYAADARLFIVHRDATETLFSLAFDFWERVQRAGWSLSIEPLLAYAMQMLCADPERHRVPAKRPA